MVKKGSFVTLLNVNKLLRGTICLFPNAITTVGKYVKRRGMEHMWVF